MVSPPAEQKQLLLNLLESMPSTEHERFLGDKLYPLVQVHVLSIYLSVYPPIYQSIYLSIYYFYPTTYAPIYYH